MRGKSKLYPLIKLAFNHAKDIICLDNEEVYQELKLMFPEKKIVASTNAIDVSKYYTSEEKKCVTVCSLDILTRGKGLNF